MLCENTAALGQAPSPEEVFRQQQSEESSISDFDNRTYDLQQGKLLRRIRAKLATEQQGTGVLSLDHPRVSGSSEEGFDWIISAESGSLYPDSKGLELQGSVFLKRTGSEQPASVTADYMRWMEEGGDVVWRGNVEVIESDIVLKGDEFRVWERSAQERGFEMHGKPASFVRSGLEEAQGKAETLRYDGFRHYMKMQGEAILTQEGFTVQGPRLEYYPSSGEEEEDVAP